MKKEIIMGYEVQRKKVKNINLRIYPDRRIFISAPVNLDSAYIENFIKSKKTWIDKIQKKLDELPKEEALLYISGERILYLGVSFCLEVVLGRENKVFLDKVNKKLVLQVVKDDYELKSRFIEKWYFEKAKSLFPKIMDRYLLLLNEKINHLSVKKMKTRWGSCNYRKRYINLSTELVKKPIECIEYVALHEIAHLRHPNHSRDFYHHIEKYMPDYKKREEALKRRLF